MWKGRESEGVGARVYLNRMVALAAEKARGLLYCGLRLSFKAEPKNNLHPCLHGECKALNADKAICYSIWPVFFDPRTWVVGVYLNFVCLLAVCFFLRAWRLFASTTPVGGCGLWVAYASTSGKFRWR